MKTNIEDLTQILSEISEKIIEEEAAISQMKLEFKEKVGQEAVDLNNKIDDKNKWLQALKNYSKELIREARSSFYKYAEQNKNIKSHFGFKFGTPTEFLK